jgi:hypothetical protein
VVACGDGFSNSCSEARNCPIAGTGQGGEAGSLADGGDGPMSSGATTNQGGTPGAGATSAGDAGSGATPGVDGGAGAGAIGSGGEGGVPATPPACPEGYQSWLTSSFSFPDGTILGTADFPSQPWISTGGLEIDTGRLTGIGSAAVGQGASFSYDGLRLRFRTRFSDSAQSTAVAFNGARNDVIGAYVTLDASGKLRLSEGEEVAGEESLAPLDTGVDYFVEAQMVGATAAVTVSTKNYGSEPQAAILATLEVSGLQASASGVKTVVELIGNGLGPAVDELSVARCGLEPPAYTNLFLDTFERADSATLGSAEFPSNATWTPSGDNAKIVGGALEVSELARAAAPLKTVPANGLRIRATLRSSGSAFWADVNYNTVADLEASNISHPGFWVWANNTTTAPYTSVFLGDANSERKHDGKTLAANTDYFAELNRDDGAAVLTVRTGSFTGPVHLIDVESGLTAGQNTGQFIKLSTESGTSTTWFDDIRVDHYVVE